jgi:glucosamine-6-phosphate deaminase
MMPFAFGRSKRRSRVLEMVISAEEWKLTVVPDERAMGEAAADVVAEVVSGMPNAAISFPTGRTPLFMFDVLAARAARGEIDFTQVEFYCLDEYLGLTAADPNSLTGWLWSAFLSRIGADRKRVHELPTTAADSSAAAAAFDAALSERGGLDLSVLGIGPNGHIGYNEPGSPVDSRTRVIVLTPNSSRQAAAYWDNVAPAPEQAMTMGVGTLLDAKRCLLIVSGPDKATILRRALEEPIGPEVPASWLRRKGRSLEVIADEAAISQLTQQTTG